jgi:hypothetical protein
VWSRPRFIAAKVSSPATVIDALLPPTEEDEGEAILRSSSSTYSQCHDRPGGGMLSMAAYGLPVQHPMAMGLTSR